MAKKNKVYVKPQLCQEFGLSERALNNLTELELIAPDWKYRHGLQVVELTPSDEKVLRCAGNSPYNDMKFRMPFQRFLNLRFIQMPLEYVAFELQSKNLLDPGKLGQDFLEKRYKQFLSRVPEELADCIEDHRPPKTKEERELFDVLLDVCELRVAYEHPEWDEVFSFMSNIQLKTIIDAALTTTGTYDEVCDFLHEVLGVGFNIQGLLFYQQMFHDMEAMTPDDIKHYFKGIEPSRRNEITAAHGTSLDAYKLKSGLYSDMRTDEVIGVAIEQVSQRLIQLVSDMDSADVAELSHVMRAFNILSDRHTKIRDVAIETKGNNVPDFFKKLSVAENKVDHGKIMIDNPNVSEEVYDT